MTKKEEFQNLINSISKKHIQSKDTKDNFYIDSEDILHIFKNLNEQIDDQSEIIHGCSKQLEIFQDALTILTRELVKKGHLQIREKRNFLLRNENTLEALITLLNSFCCGKGISRLIYLSNYFHGVLFDSSRHPKNKFSSVFVLLYRF